MSEKRKIEPKAGSLLISEPFLQDENFVRSVVLVCEHNENGSFGLVLNKLSILKLNELMDDVPLSGCEVYVGGPVEQNTLHFIYYGEKLTENSIELAKDLWWGGNFEDVLNKINLGILKTDLIRFFIGYSGWSIGQLDTEIDENTWIVSETVDSENIFTASPEELWKIILKNMGGEYQMLANYPIDPRLN
ncbi:YqgE/AlgH family protein [Mongoliibacter ruber]|uniref:Putative transcriptional regulator n=1 Tax=Mongoliibacter ruber TaxID=1750599 RepID=A0A2T0WVS8_9BACT|nr:YqgE/AlgH family protein [Mongoliibacter ruber]PRY90803.1 putative transcriptional regulator [Mongoliibacter ruber]